MTDFVIISLIIGLAYCLFSIGLTISFRVLNYPDLTIEGSLVLGGASYFLFANIGLPIFLALICSSILGFLAGWFTSILNNKLKVNKLLSGIITAAILYSINIRLMGSRSNVILNDNQRIFFSNMNIEKDFYNLLILSAIILFVLFSLFMIFKTRLGYYLRILGDNPFFLESLGKSKSVYQNIGLGLSNALIAFGGAVLVQYKGVCDINYSFGILISGLAAIILGDLIISPKNTNQVFVSNVIGTISYSFLIAFVVFNWSDSWQKYILASDVRLFSGLFLMAPLILHLKRKDSFRFFKSEW